MERIVRPSPGVVIRVGWSAIDKVLIGFGLVAATVFALVGGLLTWGSNLANDCVHELASQNPYPQGAWVHVAPWPAPSSRAPRREDAPVAAEVSEGSWLDEARGHERVDVVGPEADHPTDR